MLQDRCRFRCLKAELGFEAEKPNHDWTIHPRGVFSTHYELSLSTDWGWRTDRGNLFLNTCTFIIFFVCFFQITLFSRAYHVWNCLG